MISKIKEDTMNKYVFFFITLFLLVNPLFYANSSVDVGENPLAVFRVITWNVEELPLPYEGSTNPWEYHEICHHIIWNMQHPEIVGVQEAFTRNFYEYMMEGILEEYIYDWSIEPLYEALLHFKPWGNGLAAFSDFQMTSIRIEKWNDCFLKMIENYIKEKEKNV